MFGYGWKAARFAFAFLLLYFIFFFYLSRDFWLFYQCTINTSKISDGQCTPMGLVHCSQDPQTLFFGYFFIKNGSHSTIHTFKNYFATMFSVFSKISGIQLDTVLYQCEFHDWMGTRQFKQASLVNKWYPNTLWIGNIYLLSSGHINLTQKIPQKPHQLSPKMKIT